MSKRIGAESFGSWEFCSIEVTPGCHVKVRLEDDEKIASVIQGRTFKDGILQEEIAA